MLGVVVICIALAGALFGAYLAGIETDEHEITAYEYLADMSGEFEFDQSPQYIDFDPNTNYIGYYSTDTGKLFPLDKVDFTRYDGVNNYRIATDNSEKWLHQISGDSAFSNAHSEIYVKDGETKKARACSGKNVSLSDFIDSLNLEPDIRTVRVKSWDNYTALSAEPTNQTVNWAVFTLKSSWQSIENPPGRYINNVMLATYDAAQIPPTYPAAYTVALSAEIDVATRTVNVYADNELSIFLATYDVSDVVMLYGSGSGNVSFATAVSIEAQPPVENIYMDPTKGVELKEATA